jgi:hypothetical protein
MAAVDADVVALVAACGEIVTLADACVAASQQSITIDKNEAEDALAAAAAALPALVTAADAAVEALEA